LHPVPRFGSLLPINPARHVKDERLAFCCSYGKSIHHIDQYNSNLETIAISIAVGVLARRSWG
jgi:hypothetical protein